MVVTPGCLSAFACFNVLVFMYCWSQKCWQVERGIRKRRAHAHTHRTIFSNSGYYNCRVALYILVGCDAAEAET